MLYEIYKYKQCTCFSKPPKSPFVEKLNYHNISTGPKRRTTPFHTFLASITFIPCLINPPKDHY